MILYIYGDDRLDEASGEEQEKHKFCMCWHTYQYRLMTQRNQTRSMHGCGQLFYGILVCHQFILLKLDKSNPNNLLFGCIGYIIST